MEIRIGKVAGAPIILTQNYLVYLGILVLFDLFFHGLSTAINTAGFMVFLGVCILLHEAGHVLIGKRFGVRTSRITLNFFGGIAAANPIDAYRLMDQPKRAIAVWAAGPAVNIAIAALLTPVLYLTPQIPLLHSAITWARIINIYIACFNLLPLYPTDGGGILYSILRFFTSRRRAISTACIVSMIGCIALSLLFIKVRALVGLIIMGLVFFEAYRTYKNSDLF